jgi:hypothetical protein
VSNHLLKRLHAKGVAADVDRELWTARANAIYEGCHPKQRGPIDSVKAGFKYLSIRCPRRAGKSFGKTALALWFGEMFPNSRILIISLTLKSTKENYWAGAPGGIFSQNAKYDLNLRYNNTDLVWMHENGSRGRLQGAETIADIERIRGAMAEADLAIVDECKSFAPDLLTELIREVLQPGLMTRDGVMVLGGTPGSIPVGTFFEATSERARTDAGRVTCIPVGAEAGPAYASLSEDERAELWRLHTWTIQDNTGAPHQWVRALGDKRRMNYSDDHPSWRREYLGEWVTDATDLVYAWAGCKGKGDVTWNPQRTRTNPSGLEPSEGPWRYVLGIDLGYVDDSALVLCAYSETLKVMRHVYDFKSPEMDLDDFVDEVFHVIEKFGRPDAIVADTAGGGSKILVETLNQRYGLGIEPAKKTDKQDWIELVNSDFGSGRIQIIPGSDLAHELSGLQWDLSRDSKMILARTGRLREDPQCPNHLCDALLYLYKYAYHFWSERPERVHEKGTEQWWVEYERQQLEKALAKRREMRRDPSGFFAWKDANKWTS